LDERGNKLMASIAGKSQEFSTEIARITDVTVKSIEAKSAQLTRSVGEKSAEVVKAVTDAGDTAARTINKTMSDLHTTTQAVVDKSKQTATATVSELLETHGMVRNDATQLFERLREANGLLQEVLKGAHENMSLVEQSLSERVSEFVKAMNNLLERSGLTTTRMDEHVGTFQKLTGKVLTDLGGLAGQFGNHGRLLAQAVELVDQSNRRSAEPLNEPRTALH